MNYAEDRLDRRARNNTTEGSSTKDQLACDLKCAHDMLVSSSSSSVDTSTKQSLRELRDAHELCGKTLRDSGQNRQAVYHFGMAWRLCHMLNLNNKNMCNTNVNCNVDCKTDEHEEKAVGDYSQMCELSGFPEVGVLALLYYRAGGSLVDQAPSADSTQSSIADCGCGMTDCGSSPCYIAFPHQSPVMKDILDALDKLSIRCDDRDFPTASDILGQLSSYTKKTSVKDPVADMHTFLCKRIKNVPSILQFWNDGIVSTSNNTHHQYRTLPPVILLLLLKLLYSSPISNSFLQLACLSIPYLAARFPPSSIEGRLLARNYKSHMAYYVFIRYLVLGERVKKHRKGKVIHHVPVWDVVFRLDECDRSRPDTNSRLDEKKDDCGVNEESIPSYLSTILRDCSSNEQKEEESMPIIMQQQSTYHPIYVVGDSHVLSLAWQTLYLDTSVGQKQRQLIPFPATGIKAFHTTTPRFFTHYNLHACLQRLPPSCRTIILSAGEIDCREGIGGLLLEGYDQDCSPAVEKTVVEYLKALTELAKHYNLQVLLMPVAPHAYRSEKNGKSLGRAKRRETMHIWNDILRRELGKEEEASQQNKYNRIILLDYEEHLRQNDCNSPVGYVLDPSYNADYTHVNSALVPLVQVAIEQSGCDFTLL